MESLTVSKCGAYWHYAPDITRIEAIMQSNGVSRTMASLLSILPLNPGKEIAEYLSPDMTALHDPMKMLNMSKACGRFKQAIHQGEAIRVVTDYDVDGTMSSLILQSVLQICGHTRFSYHIPDRQTEGYGFSKQAALKAIHDGIQLIVTADIGVRDEESIALAQSHGIDVIVLDHHLPDGEGVPPSAFAVVCPPQPGCSYPNKHLAACGISLKFAQALLQDHPRFELLLRSMMKLAALGTVADVVSLIEPENRAIVSIGLDALNNDLHRPGLKALLDIAKAVPGSIDSTQIGYRIAPRINAAGRMASATLIIELLHASNSVLAAGLASRLDAMNEDRQFVQESMIQTAIQVAQTSDDPFIIIAFPASDLWHSGVSGIVAGRIREHFHRPVAVATIENGLVTGSIRSTPGVHAVKALTSVGHFMTKFGGHAAAAGFTCPIDKLNDVKAGLIQNTLEQLNGKPEIPVTSIALSLAPNEFTPELFDDLLKLEPCGSQNPKPTICIRNARLQNVRLLKEKHLRAQIEGASIPLGCIWFSTPETVAEFESSPHHLIGELSREVYNGSVRYQICVRDACLASENVFI